MESNAKADDELPDFSDEEEGVGESTVAMASPTFDRAGMPSPISVPPGAEVPAIPIPPLHMPPTAPVPFTPMPAAGAPAVPPSMGRPPSSPFLATPLGGITPGAPGAPARAPIPTPTGARPLGAAPNAPATGAKPGVRSARAQTVIGIAPPAQASAPQPQPKPAPPAAPAAAPPPPAAPMAAAPIGTPKAKLPAAFASTMIAGAPPQGGPPRPAPPGAPPPSQPTRALAAFDDDDASLGVNDASTMIGSAEQSLALFGLDEAAGKAARAALGPKPAAAKPPSSNKVPVVPPLPLPVLESNTDDESTRAVPREEIMKQAGGQFIIGDDEEAVGEDATLAIAPGDNAAANQQLAQLEQIREDGRAQLGLPPSSPHQPAYPPQQQQHPMGGWPDPAASLSPQQPPVQQQQPWGAPPPNQDWQQQHQQQQPPPQQQQWSHAPYDPRTSAPGIGPMPGSQQQQHMGYPQSGQMPASQPGGGGMMLPQMSHAPVPTQQWGMAQPSQRRFKISGQLILLGVVGVLCLTIFITGIVLFWTTKM